MSREIFVPKFVYKIYTVSDLSQPCTFLRECAAKEDAKRILAGVRRHYRAAFLVREALAEGEFVTRPDRPARILPGKSPDGKPVAKK